MRVPPRQRWKQLRLHYSQRHNSREITAYLSSNLGSLRFQTDFFQWCIAIGTIPGPGNVVRTTAVMGPCRHAWRKCGYWFVCLITRQTIVLRVIRRWIDPEFPCKHRSACRRRPKSPEICAHSDIPSPRLWPIRNNIAGNRRARPRNPTQPRSHRLWSLAG